MVENSLNLLKSHWDGSLYCGLLLINQEAMMWWSEGFRCRQESSGSGQSYLCDPLMEIWGVPTCTSKNYQIPNAVCVFITYM